MYQIRLGIPEMEALWNTLKQKVQDKTASKDDKKQYKKLGKAFALIAQNPRHPSLNTHEITVLSNRYGMKVWESYLENKVPAAGRVFWVYGPDKMQITIIGVEPHPNDKGNAYKKITLSNLPE